MQLLLQNSADIDIIRIQCLVWVLGYPHLLLGDSSLHGLSTAIKITYFFLNLILLSLFTKLFIRPSKHNKPTIAQMNHCVGLDQCSVRPLTYGTLNWF